MYQISQRDDRDSQPDQLLQSYYESKKALFKGFEVCILWYNSLL